jgi:hypothetical protein
MNLQDRSGCSSSCWFFSDLEGLLKITARIRTRCRGISIGNLERYCQRVKYQWFGSKHEAPGSISWAYPTITQSIKWDPPTIAQLAECLIRKKKISWALPATTAHRRLIRRPIIDADEKFDFRDFIYKNKIILFYFYKTKTKKRRGAGYDPSAGEYLKRATIWSTNGVE